MSTTTRTACVTGAAQGMGPAIALGLAKDGFNVAVDDVPAKLAALEELVAQIQSEFGVKAVAVAWTLRMRPAWRISLQHLGGLEVVCVVSGSFPLTPWDLL
jgi:NAD(P)-dependent dehydrogenase (short-subunit alcohol dehydrogenase family)